MLFLWFDVLKYDRGYPFYLFTNGPVVVENGYLENVLV